MHPNNISKANSAQGCFMCLNFWGLVYMSETEPWERERERYFPEQMSELIMQNHLTAHSWDFTPSLCLPSNRPITLLRFINQSTGFFLHPDSPWCIFNRIWFWGPIQNHYQRTRTISLKTFAPVIQAHIKWPQTPRILYSRPHSPLAVVGLGGFGC